MFLDSRVVGVDAGVGWWCGVLVWAVGVGCLWACQVWRLSSTWNSTTQSMFGVIVFATPGRNKLIALKAIR